MARIVEKPATVRWSLSRPTRLSRLRPQMRPTGLRRHPEDVLGGVLVAVLGGILAELGQDRGMAFLEGVGDVLQEDQAEHDVLVLGGVHRAAQGVGHGPQLGLVTGRGPAAPFRVRIVSLPPCSSSRHVRDPSSRGSDSRPRSSHSLQAIRHPPHRTGQNVGPCCWTAPRRSPAPRAAACLPNVFGRRLTLMPARESSPEPGGNRRSSRGASRPWLASCPAPSHRCGGGSGRSSPKRSLYLSR